MSKATWQVIFDGQILVVLLLDFHGFHWAAKVVCAFNVGLWIGRATYEWFAAVSAAKGE